MSPEEQVPGAGTPEAQGPDARISQESGAGDEAPKERIAAERLSDEGPARRAPEAQAPEQDAPESREATTDADDAATEPERAEAPADGRFTTLPGTAAARAARGDGPSGRDAVVTVATAPIRHPVRVVRRGGPLSDWTARDTAKAVAVIAAVALFLIPVALLLAQRDRDAAVAARQADAYTPPPVAAAGSTPRRTGPVIAVVGDESVISAAPGVTTAQRWPALVGTSLDSTVDLLGVTNGGYATTGDDGVTFLNAAANIASDTDVVLFVGGANDAGISPAALSRAANNAAAAAADRAPGVSVAIVGPVVTDGASPARLAAVRAVLADAASSTGVRWYDPIAAGWLPAPRASASALTAADEKLLATRLAALAKRLAA